MREIGASLLSSAFAANEPSATITFGWMMSICLDEKRLARHDFVRFGIAVAGRAALQDVGDVHVGAFEPDRFDDLRQQLPRPADERLPLNVFVGARRLAHEHEIGFRIPHAEHDLPSPKPVELAAGAIADVLPKLGERRGRIAVAARRDWRRWKRRLDHHGWRLGLFRDRQLACGASGAIPPGRIPRDAVHADLAEEA